jgi:hypothetical protein
MSTTPNFDLFEQATRLALRFDSPKGLLSVEDLWGLPLTSPSGNRANLDAIAIDLHKQTRDIAEVVSFVTPETDSIAASVRTELLLKFEVIKHIIRVRVAERDQAREALDRKEKKQRLLALIAQKEDAALGEKSVEELRALAESL